MVPGTKRRKPAIWTNLRSLLEINTETPVRLALVAVLAALCGTGVLYILNSEAKDIEQQGYNLAHAVIFVLLLVTYRVSQLALIRRAAAAIETALDAKRRRAIRLVLSLSLRDLDQIEKQTIRSGLSAHYGAISQALVPLISGFEAIILLVFMFGYLVYLSPLAAGITVGVLSLTIIGYANHHKKMTAALRSASDSENAFQRQTDGIVGGAKELQLSSRKRQNLKEAMFSNSEGLAKARVNAAEFFADLIATGTSISYFLAGIVVFILPIFSGSETDNLSQTVIAIIFILSPIGSVVQSMQHASTAQYSLRSINDFETTLAGLADPATVSDEEEKSEPAMVAFETIKLDSVSYQHDGEHGFAIKNINLDLKKGEILFITGGNGSGKTTLLRIITGLYPRAAGSIKLNETNVERTPRQPYRELFASVFSDFYLFDGLYGLSDSDRSTLERWLRALKIRDKLAEDLTNLHGDDLSTGQRKRLALALALTEGRPILVLDEWAADQDPETRRWFYESLLPELREQGFTCLIITHDESYFKHCDRRIHMVEGRIVDAAKR